MQRNCRLCVYLAATRNVFAKEQNTTEENTNAQTEVVVFFLLFFSVFSLFSLCRMSDEEEDYMSDAFLSKL